MSLSSSSNSSRQPTFEKCLFSRMSISMSTAFLISYVLLLLPPVVFVLCVGYQRWRRQRSVATTATTSHSDIFTFNMVVMEMIGMAGSCIFCIGVHINQTSAVMVGMYIYSIVSPGGILFHLLTCVERYLAVVHPVTYLGLRQAGGVRIRNISVGCVWLLCFGSVSLSELSEYVFNIYNLVLSVSSLVVVSFCSLSVLRVLIRPGPGEGGGNREQVDQSKQRAFHTMTAITGALLLKFLSILVSSAIYSADVLNPIESCLVAWSAAWLSLPSSLVLPLLFLHRAGKLPGCKRNTVSASELG